MGLAIGCACGAVYDAPDRMMGKRVKCPNCPALLLVEPPQSAAPGTSKDGLGLRLAMLGGGAICVGVAAAGFTFCLIGWLAFNGYIRFNEEPWFDKFFGVVFYVLGQPFALIGAAASIAFLGSSIATKSKTYFLGVVSVLLSLAPVLHLLYLFCRLIYWLSQLPNK
jgi:hypothetical protein